MKNEELTCPFCGQAFWPYARYPFSEDHVTPECFGRKLQIAFFVPIYLVRRLYEWIIIALGAVGVLFALLQILFLLYLLAVFVTWAIGFLAANYHSPF
jgi:hypothetical protein